MNIKMLQNLMEEKYTEVHFEVFLQFLDGLHDAATVGELNSVSPMDIREILGWLDDIIYTAEETVREIQESLETPDPKYWTEN